MVTLSIIILSYNTEELLEKCLRSIYEYLPKNLFEVIIVDNHSSDGSVQMVKKKYPQVSLVQSETNLGFSKGINLGSRTASGKYLLFLNSDAQLIDNTLVELVNFIKSEKNVGFVGGLLTNPDGSVQRSYGSFYTLPHVLKMLLGGDSGETFIHKFLDKPTSVDWVTGGFMLVEKHVFQELHGFDENFFMYMEDMELCYRAKKKGYINYVYPESRILHLSQGSSNRSFAIQYIYKGLLYFYQKHMSRWEFQLLKFLLTAKAAVLIVFGVLTNNAYLRTTYKKALER